MAWKLLHPPKTVRVTKKLAKEFAEMESVPNDRPLSERRLVVYRKQFADGGFRPVTWATCKVDEIGTTIRINGKHTSILLSSMDVIPEFYCTIEEYTAPTLADAVRLYRTFDSQQQTRTAADIYVSFAGACPELRDIPKSVIVTAASAIPYARVQDRAYDYTAGERAEMILDHVEFILWADGILRPEDAKCSTVLRRSPIMAAMLLTWERDRKAASTFWVAVRDETGIDPEGPDRRLARWLATTAFNRAQGTRAPRSKKADPREFFVRCLRAWNSWRSDGKDMLRYYHADAELPTPV